MLADVTREQSQRTYSMGGKAGKKKTVTVALEDLVRVCHSCGRVKDSTTNREFYTKNYKGPCGDSFCYASCDMEACRPVRRRICTECEKKLSR